MSYCRFSCLDGQCEVYCYESCYGGFVTHVAMNRVTFSEDLPPPVPFDPVEGWLARHRKVSDMLAKAKRSPIGLPHDGETFNDNTAEDAADRLEALQAMGYRVPQHAIEALRDKTEL